MANIINKKAVLLENLQDAGCDSEMIACCMSMAETHSEYGMLPLLQQFRTCLLDRIHEEQDKLTSLDYLIYKIKTNDQGE